jgi:hypothetical protein
VGRLCSCHGLPVPGPRKQKTTTPRQKNGSGTGCEYDLQLSPTCSLVGPLQLRKDRSHETSYMRLGLSCDRVKTSYQTQTITLTGIGPMCRPLRE